MSPRREAALAAVLLAILLLVWLAVRPRSAEELAASADALVAGVIPAVTIDEADLLAARAIADFGIGGDVRLVLVRIVDELGIEIRLQSPTDVTLAAPIRACLVGPDPAPDDAGLEDRCWAGADLGPLIEAQLVDDGEGRYRIAANAPVTLVATLTRGGAGCDYPPGTWHMELLLDPVIDGAAMGPRYAPPATFEVPYLPDEPLRLVGERRYCGLASKVYREQGEPAIAGG